MNTVLRVPVYLEIETGNVDRAKVTKAMQQIIIPEIVRNLVSFGNKMTFTQKEKEELQNLVGPFQCKLLSEVQALVKPQELKSSVNHNSKKFDIDLLNEFISK